jgi:hypothetical protein
MSAAARPAPVLDADFIELGDQRRTDRRGGERRAPRMTLDPLFAVTLVNHVSRSETLSPRQYVAAPRGPRSGIVVNVRA